MPVGPGPGDQQHTSYCLRTPHPPAQTLSCTLNRMYNNSSMRISHIFLLPAVLPTTKLNKQTWSRSNNSQNTRHQITIFTCSQVWCDNLQFCQHSLLFLLLPCQQLWWSPGVWAECRKSYRAHGSCDIHPAGTVVSGQYRVTHLYCWNRNVLRSVLPAEPFVAAIHVHTSNNFSTLSHAYPVVRIKVSPRTELTGNNSHLTGVHTFAIYSEGG